MRTARCSRIDFGRLANSPEVKIQVPPNDARENSGPFFYTSSGPVHRPSKLRYGHQFDRQNSQILRFTQPGNNSLKRTFGSECPHVSFVEGDLANRQTSPPGSPPEAILRAQPGGPTDTIGLEVRSRIGSQLLAISAKVIQISTASLGSMTSLK